MTENIEFIDLEAQQSRIKDRIDAAISRVLTHGEYIMGREVLELERRLSEFSGAKNTIACSNGTDAIGLILMAWGLRKGDAVLCPSFTFASTAEVICWLGATPVFVDIDPRTYNMCPASLEAAIAASRAAGLRPKVVIAVDLFGQPADYDRIKPIVADQKLKLICDSAQGFGATYKGQVTGSIGDAATTSFFPAKPLGCYGDGGAMFTPDDDLANVLRSLRVHGKGASKYDNVRIGMNARLDTIQAAILIEKLAIYPDEIIARNAIAARYSDLLKDKCFTPKILDRTTSVWAQYTIGVTPSQRATLQAGLSSAGIPTNVYYSKPLHQQGAFQRYGALVPLLQTEQAAASVLSLPMHPYLLPEVQERIISTCRSLL